jgi:mono/diheme cytochrome c family protein
MRRFLAAVFVLALPFAAAALRAQTAPAGAAEPVGTAAQGKVHYTFGNTSCSNCHGITGEGRFGPPLAGRTHTYARFRAYVRNPLGRMPAYPASELNDQEIADMVAYFNSLPAPEKTMIEWRTPLPTMAPRGQQVMIGILGCGQCHGATITTPRHGAAEVTGDFEWFKRMTYEHTTAQREQMALLAQDPAIDPVTPGHVGLPPGRNRLRMGNYSRARLPEKTLREIWDWIDKDLGVHLPVLTASIKPGTPGPNGVTYTIDVQNAGVKGKGITNDDVTISVALPAGAKVVTATGPYEGVKPDAAAKSDVALWRVPRMAAGDRQTFTLTLAQPAAALRGVIRWATPKVNAEDSDVTFAYSATGGRGRGGA